MTLRLEQLLQRLDELLREPVVNPARLRLQSTGRWFYGRRSIACGPDMVRAFVFPTRESADAFLEEFKDELPPTLVVDFDRDDKVSDAKNPTR